MACKDHSEATTMNLEKTELEKFIDECGEDMSEAWEIVDEEIVDGEHQDFEFEKVLNDYANEKIELASTGTARPNARSEQDGTNKSDNEFYKVRYVYTKDNFLSQDLKTGSPSIIPTLLKSSLTSTSKGSSPSSSRISASVITAFKS